MISENWLDEEIHGEDFIYLDHAATSYPKPDSVLENMIDLYRRLGVNPGRSGGDLHRLANDLIESTRADMASLFGLQNSERVHFTANATMALNTAIFGLLRPGDHVLTSITEHNSVIRPLHHCQQAYGLEITWIAPDESGLIQPEDIIAAKKDNTRAVILNHASNVTGTIQPLQTIGAVCSQLNLLFIVDAAQTAGVVPVNMEEACIDALAITGHKSLLAPAGTGALLLSERCNPTPLLHGGTGVDSHNPLQPEKHPFKFEAGTLNLPGIAGMNQALKLLSNIDLQDKQRKLNRLLTRLADGLLNLEHVRVSGYNPNAERTPVLNFNIIGVDPETVATFLDVDYSIVCRTGLHCAPKMHEWLGTGELGSIRFSLGISNTELEVDKALAAIEDIIQITVGS